MTDLASGLPAYGEPAPECGPTAGRQREPAVAVARRFLSSLAAENISRLPARRLRDRLAGCRALLEAVVQTSDQDQIVIQ